MELKLKEADRHMKEGESYASRSFLRWKPDFAAAGPEFEKAGTRQLPPERGAAQ